MQAAMKVGALARRTGLTVRTLHHYDEIGLLSPSHRTQSGHRLYGSDELGRLQQIASLKHLGLPLEEIRECLTRSEYSLERVLDLQIERIDEQIQRHERLRALLEALRDRVSSGEGVSMDDFARTVELTVNYAKYYTPDQLAELNRRRLEVGEGRMQEVQREWARLFDEFGLAMEEGLPPDHDRVRELSSHAAELVAEFTGGDPAMASSLSALHEGEGPENVMESHDMPMPSGLWQYMAEARAALARG